MSAKQTSRLKSAAIAILAAVVVFSIGKNWPDEFEAIGSLVTEHDEDHSHVMGYQPGRDPYLFAPTLPAVYEDGPMLDDGYGFGDITAYASLSVTEGIAQQTGINATPVRLNQFVSIGPTYRVLADHDDDRIEIEKAGTYRVDFSISFNGAANQTFTFRVCVNDIPRFPGVKSQIVTAVNVVSGATAGVMELDDGDVVTVFVHSNGSNDTLDVAYANLMVQRIR